MVFGSNLAGRHGAGAALMAAKQFGAAYGIGVGRTGRCYAIPTKDANIRTLPLSIIQGHVSDFLNHALLNPWSTFLVTKIGCGLAGYSAKDIAPMFAGASENVHLPEEFISVIEQS